MIHTGDCIEVMRGMPADSVDAVVTDPPYGIEFMGKAWDAFKATGSSSLLHSPKDEGRTFTNASGHMWDNTKALPRLTAGPAFQAWCQQWGTEALRVTKPGGYLLAFGGTRTHHRLVCGLEDAGWIIRDELTWVYASGFPKGKANLKPAHEPIVLARKPGPLRPLGIDAARIGTELGDYDHPGNDNRHQTETVYGKFDREGRQAPPNPQGRWPSNVLLSDPDLFDEPNPEVVGSGATSGGGEFSFSGERADRDNPVYGKANLTRHSPDTYGDTGGYSRFFIVPKSSRSDREPIIMPDGHDRSKRFSTHPTQKPTDLMAHLIRLVCPPDGVILDPFLGSGSTAVAAEREGVKWIGIEKEPEYVAIAEARLNGTQRGLGLSA